VVYRPVSRQRPGDKQRGNSFVNMQLYWSCCYALRRKGKSQIWDSKIRSRVPRDSEPRKTALARDSSIYKRKTRPLVREGAQQKQDRNCQTVINIWSRAKDGALHQDLLTDRQSQCDSGFEFVQTRVEAGSNTSTVAQRVVGGDEKGSLESETVKYVHESHGTGTWGWLRWQEPAAIVNDRPVISSERAPHINKTATVWQQ
jgi:hypothetical protein